MSLLVPLNFVSLAPPGSLFSVAKESGVKENPLSSYYGSIWKHAHPLLAIATQIQQNPNGMRRVIHKTNHMI